MVWWNKVVARLGGDLKGRKFRLTSTLYNQDASRSADLLDFGLLRGTYLRERERVADGQFLDRHAGVLVGPFTSPKAAETFIVATTWFNGGEGSSPPIAVIPNARWPASRLP
jgi:hypothetical protein